MVIFRKHFPEIAFSFMQTTIGQRLKFLLNHFNLSARKFSREIGVPENNTQNYLPPNEREPGAEYLRKVLLTFESIDAHWLVTGDGDPWVRLEDGSLPDESFGKNNSGQVAGVNHGTMSQVNEPGNRSYSRSMVVGHVAGNASQHSSSVDQAALIEQLRSQLADKERTIQILLAQKS